MVDTSLWQLLTLSTLLRSEFFWHRLNGVLLFWAIVGLFPLVILFFGWARQGALFTFNFNVRINPIRQLTPCWCLQWNTIDPSSIAGTATLFAHLYVLTMYSFHWIFLLALTRRWIMIAWSTPWCRNTQLAVYWCDVLQCIIWHTWSKLRFIRLIFSVNWPRISLFLFKAVTVQSTTSLIVQATWVAPCETIFTGHAKVSVWQSFRIQVVVLLIFVEIQAILSVAHHLVLIAVDSS